MCVEAVFLLLFLIQCGEWFLSACVVLFSFCFLLISGPEIPLLCIHVHNFRSNLKTAQVVP
jgi:hypothetical protein